MTATGDELKRAMATRGITIKDLSAQAGVSYSSIRAARSGRYLPLQDTVVRLSEVLMWPGLVSIAARARAATCAICEQPYQRDRQQGRRRFCSRRCAMVAHARGQRGLSRKQSAADLRLARSRLTMFQAAVADFCRTCTAGEMICRTEDCELRPVSPIQFVPMTRASRRNVA